HHTVHPPPHHPHHHPLRTRHHHLDTPQQPTPTHPRRMRPHHPLARPHLHHHMEKIPTPPHPPQPPRPTTRPRTTTILTPGTTCCSAWSAGTPSGALTWALESHVKDLHGKAAAMQVLPVPICSDCSE